MGVRYRTIPVFLGAVLILILVHPVVAHASFGFGRIPDPVSVSPTETGAVSVRNNRGQFRLSVRIDSGWHVNSDESSGDLIPLSVTAVDTAFVDQTQVQFPEPVEYEFAFSERPLRVFKGTINPRVSFRLEKQVTSGTRPVIWRIRYQACSQDQCLRPSSDTITVNITVPDKPERPVERPQTADGDTSRPSTGFSSQSSDPGPSGVRQYFNTGEWFFGFVLVFLVGLSLNLTPCVYPMIPITVGYFGRENETSLRENVTNAGLYVTGIVLTYAILGAIAGVSGSIFGSFLQHPLTNIVIAGIILVMALSMFELFQVVVPDFLQQWADAAANQFGPFGMGATLGVVAAPCVAPATVSLLALVGQSGSVVFGFSLFLALGLGLALPYFCLGVFSVNLNRLPHSGEWLRWVENLLGCLLVGVSLYFLWPYFSSPTMGWMIVIWLLGSAGYLTLAHPPEQTAFYLLRGTVVLLAALVLSYFFYNTFIRPKPTLEWESGKPFVSSNPPYEKPVVVYFGADWCFPCKRMKVSTFSDPSVRENSSPIKLVKVDLTRSPAPSVSKWMKEREIQGVPMLVFLKRNGKELHGLRSSGYVPPSEFLRRINKLKATDSG